MNQGSSKIILKIDDFSEISNLLLSAEPRDLPVNLMLSEITNALAGNGGISLERMCMYQDHRDKMISNINNVLDSEAYRRYKLNSYNDMSKLIRLSEVNKKRIMEHKSHVIRSSKFFRDFVQTMSESFDCLDAYTNAALAIALKIVKLHIQIMDTDINIMDNMLAD